MYRTIHNIIVTYIIIFYVGINTINSQYSNCNFLCNVDFENEKLVNPGQFGFFDQNRISCWNTTATDSKIEIWGSGFGGVPAYSGSQFAELNANMVSTLYQNFTAAHGAQVEISFAHRGRAGLDRMRVEIGPAGGPYFDLGIFSADNKQWEYNTVNFNFPDTGLLDYSIRFVSVSAAGGTTVGNFLDAISIQLKAPELAWTIMKPQCPLDSSGIIKLHSFAGALPFHFQWDDINLSTDSILHNLPVGEYTVEVADFYGCKTEYSILLTAAYSSDSVQLYDTACEYYYWDANGQYYSDSGIHLYQTKNQYDCDSLIFLNLTINKISKHIDSVKSCSVYNWSANNRNYNSTGIYYDTLVNVNGCDSIVQLVLNILPAFEDTSKIMACEFFVWPVNGQQYDQSGHYVERFLNVHGCDSVHFLDLVITKNSFEHLYVETCDEFQFMGQQYNTSGEYRFVLNNALSCDSVIYLHLKIYDSYTKIDTVVSCEEYYWPETGKLYHTTGLYSQVYQSSNSCDSVIVLDLKILGTDSTECKISSCNYYEFPATQQLYTTSGIFPIHLKANTGCDSIVLLDLEIFKDDTLEIRRNVCREYYWPLTNSYYSSSGSYEYYLKTIRGCDSLIKLELVVYPEYVITDTIFSFESYYWNPSGKWFDQSGIYQLQNQTGSGCDSMQILVLNILKKGDVFVPNVFSPNGDGVNDKFTVYSTPEIERIDQLSIYSRWGEQVFKLSDFPPNNLHYGWDGYFKSEKMMPGVFSYMVKWTDHSGEQHLTTGDVTLIR